MRVFLVIMWAQMLFSDPFYYGIADFKTLRLFGILHTKANLNGNWVSLHTTFMHENESFKLLALQDSCVILENMESKTQQKLCKEKPKFIKEKGKEK
ncbi:hypothetical protein [uncultured Helicobacter sp.]|uniref:hypothetical protein n=1 Tax=uncultured Helicobacter sp. TaxID=175537 RepID=UPI002638B18A|nr:hypothetical protein [uncultured Helicobacter sp.]